jgi:hypothetical protein
MCNDVAHQTWLLASGTVMQEHNGVRDTRLSHELAFYFERLDAVSP